jgi:hypothetical protein
MRAAGQYHRAAGRGGIVGVGIIWGRGRAPVHPSRPLALMRGRGISKRAGEESHGWLLRAKTRFTARYSRAPNMPRMMPLYPAGRFFFTTHSFLARLREHQFPPSVHRKVFFSAPRLFWAPVEDTFIDQQASLPFSDWTFVIAACIWLLCFLILAKKTSMLSEFSLSRNKMAERNAIWFFWGYSTIPQNEPLETSDSDELL